MSADKDNVTDERAAVGERTSQLHTERVSFFGTGRLIDQKDDENQEIELHRAVYREETEIVTSLITAGASLDLLD